jgi:hypothetical protein
LTQNPDVADGVETGVVLDAQSHFNDSGYYEGRAHDPSAEETVRRWLYAIEESAGLLEGKPIEGDLAIGQDESA